MNDLIVCLIIVAIIITAVIYIVKQKKKGVKCIGCPSGGSCGKSSCSCKEKR